MRSLPRRRCELNAAKVVPERRLISTLLRYIDLTVALQNVVRDNLRSSHQKELSHQSISKVDVKALENARSHVHYYYISRLASNHDLLK
jgi:hypothetical protein